MIDYDEIIEMSPFVLNHLITLNKTHDFYINQYIKQTDILPSQYYMLMLLYFKEDVIQSDIAKACFMDRSGVSRAFKDFEEKGLIVREIDPNNKRAYKTKLTEKGKKTAEFLKQKELEWDEMICNEVGVDREDLFKILSEVSFKSLIYNREKFLDL